MDQLATARRIFELYALGDDDALIELVDPEVTIAPLGRKDSLYEGHDGLRRLIADSLAREHEILDFRENGEHVVVLGWRRDARAEWPDIPEAWVLGFRNGKVGRVTSFSNRREALESVGLS